MSEIQIPLARCADRFLARLARATGSGAISALEGQGLLAERARIARLRIPDRISAGGGCRLFDASDAVLALNLARPDDRELLPALLRAEDLDVADDAAIAARIEQQSAAILLERGRALGLAIAAEDEQIATATLPCVELASGPQGPPTQRRGPRIVDLSALWAGPLASHLLWLTGAEVIKVESRRRPDAMRHGDASFYALLNQGKESVVLDFQDNDDRRALLDLIATADIVIEAARPRALAQLGIDAAALLQATPGLVWITITGHGAQGPAANWIGFGDDCGVAAGLSAALREATGQTGFVGDAIADPLSGMLAALTAWEAWATRKTVRYGISMSHVVAHCLAEERAHDLRGFHHLLRGWRNAIGQPFPQARIREVAPLAALGEHTVARLSQVQRC